jgi:methionyl-tRNA formyltransferase
VTPARVAFVGSGPFGVETLRRLTASPSVELVGIVTAPPRPAGRSREPKPTPIAIAARAMWIPILTPDRLRAPESVAEVLALRPDLLVLADYGQIVPPALLDLPHGALNLHPSLLPRHRGASPIQAAILAGDRETGVTLMRMDAGLDTGPIVAVERVTLDGTETAPELERRLAILGADLLERSLEPWIRGDLPATPQPSEGATVTTPLRRDHGRLDASRPAAELERQVRAYQPWPGSWLKTNVGRLVVWSAEAAPADGGKPGEIVADADGIALLTAEGRLRLVEVQPAGGGRMSGAAFRRGRPAIVSA